MSRLQQFFSSTKQKPLLDLIGGSRCSKTEISATESVCIYLSFNLFSLTIIRSLKTRLHNLSFNSIPNFFFLRRIHLNYWCIPVFAATCRFGLSLTGRRSKDLMDGDGRVRWKTVPSTQRRNRYVRPK